MPTLPDGENRRKVAWLTATPIVLAAIGTVYFGWRREPGARDVVEHAAASEIPASARINSAGADDAARQLAARRETEPGRGKLPKSPVDDPFGFIRGLAKSAYEGDGEAQYRIAKELDRCGMTLSLVRKSSDPEADIWNLPEGWTQGMKERAFAEYHRCERLSREDAFAKLPPRQGGYTVNYWLSRATESGQPLALVEKAVSTLITQRGESVQADEAARTEARGMLVKAALSGNPDALLLMGFRMRDSSDELHDSQGAAWMLAGCEAGADCGFDSAIVPFWMCYDGGDVECQPGIDVDTMLRRGLSPAQLAQAYARYQRIKEAVRVSDDEAINAEIGF